MSGSAFPRHSESNRMRLQDCAWLDLLEKWNTWGRSLLVREDPGIGCWRKTEKKNSIKMRTNDSGSNPVSCKSGGCYRDPPNRRHGNKRLVKSRQPYWIPPALSRWIVLLLLLLFSLFRSSWLKHATGGNPLGFPSIKVLCFAVIPAVRPMRESVSVYCGKAAGMSAIWALDRPLEIRVVPPYVIISDI